MKKKQYHGFTLLELLVVLGITSFALLAINQLFQEVTGTVRRTSQAGEILQHARAMTDQLNADFKLKQVINDPDPTSGLGEQWRSRMVGPKGNNGDATNYTDPGGFLVIVQNHVNAPLTEEDLDQMPVPTQDIRSDQVMFFVNSGNGEFTPYPAVAPADVNTYSADQMNAERAKYVRLWLGHTMKLPDNGFAGLSGFSAWANIAAAYDLGIASGDSTYNPNEVAANWMVGRHALLMTGKDLNTTVNKFEYYPHGIAANRRELSAGNPDPDHSGLETAENADIIRVYDDGTVLAKEQAMAYELYYGITDIAAIDLADITGDPANPTYLSPITQRGDYKRRVFGLDGNDPLVFTTRRLFTATQPTDTNMSAPDVAATHTGFANGVSDFIVEFAGDMYTAGTGAASGTIFVDAAGYNSTAASVTPHLPTGGMNPDGRLDVDMNGQIMWYSAPFYSNHPSYSGAQLETYTENKPLVYPTEAPTTGATMDAAPVSNRYFPLSALGAPYGQFAFLWEDKANSRAVVPETEWPWLIRIRYRLHDTRGEFEGRRLTDQSPEKGEWFEMVLPVNRQPY